MLPPRGDVAVAYSMTATKCSSARNREVRTVWVGAYKSCAMEASKALMLPLIQRGKMIVSWWSLVPKEVVSRTTGSTDPAKVFSL